MLKRVVASSLARFGFTLLRGDPRSELAAVRTKLAEARAELAACRQELAACGTDLAGYRNGYEQVTTRLAAAHMAIAERQQDADGYRGAYDRTCYLLNQARLFLGSSCRRSPRPPQVVFLHIQKTAGHSLSAYLGRHFDDVRVLQAGEPGQLDVYSPGELEHYDLVYGHIAWRNLVALRADRFLLTFLRDPVDRVVSLYHYLRDESGMIARHLAPGPLPEVVVRARRAGLVEFVRDEHPDVQARVRDHITYAFAHDWSAPRLPDDPDVLVRALANLQAFDFVGVTEFLEESVDALARRLGWGPREGPLGRANATAERPPVSALTTQEREAVESVTRMDQVLYAAARSNLGDVIDRRVGA